MMDRVEDEGIVEKLFMHPVKSAIAIPSETKFTGECSHKLFIT